MGMRVMGGSILSQGNYPNPYVMIHRIVVFFKNVYFFIWPAPGLSGTTWDLPSSSWHVGSLAATCGFLFAACGSSSTRD